MNANNPYLAGQIYLSRVRMAVSGLHAHRKKNITLSVKVLVPNAQLLLKIKNTSCHVPHMQLRDQ